MLYLQWEFTHLWVHLANWGMVAQGEVRGKESSEALGEGVRHDSLEGVKKAYCLRR